ncbi:MAG: DUF4436 family protein [Microbacteriaceae bacterium]
MAILLYLVVIVLYASSGRFAPLGSLDRLPPAGGITVVLTPESVDAAGARVQMNMQVVPSQELLATDGFTFSRGFSVIVSPVAGQQAITFAAGSVQSVVPLDIIVDGSVENWPLDQYREPDLLIFAYTGDGVDKKAIPVEVRTLATYIPGWNLDWHVNKSPTAVADSTLLTTQDGLRTIDLRVFRSGSTIAFGIVLLVLMTVMAALVLFVSIAVLRGKRKVEPSFMSWTAAMLFATIPLRTFLPGSPPIGSWIDYLVVLWVVVGLICGMVIYVTAWWRWGARAQ